MNVEPLRMSFRIECAPAHAFAVWTTWLSTWWPKGHTTSGDPGAVVTLEPRLGGRIYERTSSGAEIDWGEITQWDPPHRFAYVWHIGRARDHATDVDVSFVDTDDGATELRIVHSGWERLGAEGQAWREANTVGWAGMVPSFRAAAEG